MFLIAGNQYSGEGERTGEAEGVTNNMIIHVYFIFIFKYLLQNNFYLKKKREREQGTLGYFLPCK